jgi:hypothetical protein
MSIPKLPKNSGWQDLEYDLGLGAEGNARVGRILNEVCHVFHGHAEGVWRDHDKDAYASLIANEIREKRSLVRVLLNTDDRVVKMVTYRAVELLESEASGTNDR